MLSLDGYNILSVQVYFSFSFYIFMRVTLQHSWLSRGPLLKRKNIQSKIQSFTLYSRLFLGLFLFLLVQTALIMSVSILQSLDNV